MRGIVKRFAFAIWCLLHCAASAAEMHRVALNAFTTDENVWESMSAAHKFAALIQAELAKEKTLEFVEREQLGLANKELALNAMIVRPSLSSTMQRARLNKAEWLIDARFATANGDRELHIEIIDLAHADLLAEHRLKVGKATDPLRGVLAHYRTIADAVRDALRAAGQREREVANLPIVAVLFFPDSEVFQRAFAAALADPKLPGGPLRVLRFPNANESLEEAQLVLGGFAEDADGAWRSVADAYLWGSLVRKVSRSIDGEEATDALTPMISVTVWNGAPEPDRKSVV